MIGYIYTLAPAESLERYLGKTILQPDVEEVGLHNCDGPAVWGDPKICY
jgi:hypothetical protein